MVRQSCAIGPCPEKTYKKSEGVTFFYMINVKDNDLKRAWKDRILNTRKDVRSRDELNHVAICSRHFKDGDPSNIPTIIPKIHGGEVVWPETEKQRPKVIRRALDFNDSASPPSSPPDVESEPPPSLTPKFKSELQQKLDQIRTVMTESPPKIVKEIEKRKADEINEMTPAVKSIYNQFLKEKTNKEPDGVRPHVSKSTPNAKDSLIQHLKDLLDVEMRQNADLRLQLHEKINGNVFGIERFRCSPCDIQFYTGMPDYLTFLALCDFLQPERHKMQSLYYERKDTDSAYALNRGRDPILSIHEQLFLVLCRLRQGHREVDLAHRFEISTSTVSDIISKWIKHMGHVLTQLPIWAPRSLITRRLPQTFQDLGYSNTRCIIDCTEIFIQQPSSNLVLQTVLFSTYKNHHTAKGLVAIAPHGPVTFVSDLYAGSATDYDITKDCGLLNLIQEDDHIMADKGFEIQDLLDPLNVRVDHPPILRGVHQMSIQQETSTRRIARLRIHVERAIERIKNFRILQENFPYKQWRMLNDIWKICAILTHFQPKLIDD